MNQLLDKLKTQDRFIARLLRGLQVIYWIMIPIYAAFFIFSPSTEMLVIERIGGLCFVVSFLILAILFNQKARKYRTVDYALPSVMMLEKAAERYQLWKPELVYAMVAVLFVDVGLVLFWYNETSELSMFMRVLKVQAFLLPLMALSFSVGVVWWYFKHKPLRDHALKLLDELKS